MSYDLLATRWLLLGLKTKYYTRSVLYSGVSFFLKRGFAFFSTHTLNLLRQTSNEEVRAKAGTTTTLRLCVCLCVYNLDVIIYSLCVKTLAHHIKNHIIPCKGISLVLHN